MTCTRVKICGITRVEDAIAAADAGVDAIGMVFYPGSPRFVALDTARDIAAAVGPFVTRVALLVNPSRADVEKIVDQLRPDLLQFHGDEKSDFCDSFARPYIKAIRMRPDSKPLAAMAEFPGASGFLFDTWNADKYGGTGRTFDWRQLPEIQEKPFILAGGLTADNVADAVQEVRPYAVDVSGGVESSPGIKDTSLMQAFVQAVKFPRQSI